MADRTTRIQAAVIKNQEILLLRVRDDRVGRSFWVIPGGGREPGESDEACLRREVREETHLEVRVERLLFSERSVPGDQYLRTRTYHCTPVGGQARPGSEPELEQDGQVGIAAVGWIPLFDESSWETDLRQDSITAPLLRRIGQALKDTR